MTDSQKFTEDCKELRRKSPLVHNITNYVAMNLAAESLLAAGASPFMSFCPEEAADIVAASDAVAINIGCLDSQVVKAAKIAAAAALSLKKKWVLDPVGAGYTPLRNKVAADLTLHYAPTAIRGNASEIISLSASLGLCDARPPKGADSTAESAEAVKSAEALSKLSGAVVSISGETDYIVGPDGRVESVPCGSPLMPRVPGLGCTATALTAAFLAVNDDSFLACLHAMMLMGLAGAKAAEGCPGTGSFPARFVDVLSNL